MDIFFLKSVHVRCQDHEMRCCVVDSVIFMMDTPRDSLRMAFGLVDLVDLRPYKVSIQENALLCH